MNQTNLSPQTKLSTLNSPLSTQPPYLSDRERSEPISPNETTDRIIAAASAATLAGCGKSDDKRSKISTTIKPMGTTAATTVAGTTSATESTVAIQDENGNILSTLPPNENAQQPSGNSVTDAALSYFSVSSANGYNSSVYNTYTTASGAELLLSRCNRLKRHCHGRGFG